MTDPLKGLRAEAEALAARLEAAVSEADRRAVLDALDALDGRAAGTAAALATMRQRLHDLRERARAPAPAPPQPSPSRAAPRQADHLGASTYVEKGWSCIAQGDHAGAIAALTEARRLAPDDPQAEGLLGWALMLDDRHDEALELFSRVLAADPANALARVNLGYVCFRKGLLGEAIEHLSRVLKEDRDRKAALYANYYLGLVYLERAMYADAQLFFRQALALGPNLHEAAHGLGRALWFAGDHQAAREAWRSAAAAGRHTPWGRRCAELLARVEAGGEVPR